MILRKLRIFAVVAAVITPAAVVGAPSIIEGFASFVNGRAAPTAPTGSETIPLVQNGATTAMPLTSLVNYLSSLGFTTKAYVLGFLQQNYTLQVPSAAALRNLVGFPGIMVRRGGYATSGDGGGALYAFNTAACGTDDGGSCLNASGGGSWQIDWASVPYAAANPCLFESCPIALDDTAAIKKAVAVGITTYLPALNRSNTGNRYVVSSDISQTISGQLIFGDGKIRSMIQVASNSGFSNGVIVSTAAEPGPILRDFGIVFIHPNSGSATPAASQPAPTQYVPAVYAQNVPRWRSEHMGYYACWICVDMRGNDGGTTFQDTQMSDFKYGRMIDESYDTVRVEDDHVFPFFIPTYYYNYYILSIGLPGSYNQIHNYVGRVDDLKISGGIYLAGEAFDIHKSMFNPSDGVPATVTFSGTRFDVSPGLNCSYGSVAMSGIQGGSGNQALTGIQNNGCNLSVSNSYMQVSNTGTSSASAPGGSAMYTITGNTSLSNNIYDIGSADASVVVAAGGHTTETGDRFNRNANISYPNNAVITVTGGDAVLLGNSINSIGSGSGRFIAVTQDSAANRVGWNSSPGYPNYTPTNPSGIYGSN